MGFSCDSLMKLTMKVFRYPGTGASIFCVLQKPPCNSKFIVNVRKTEEIYCFLWCFTTHIHKADTQRDCVSQFKKHYIELNVGNTQFAMKNEITKKWTFDYLNTNIFEFTSFNDILP